MPISNTTITIIDSSGNSIVVSAGTAIPNSGVMVMGSDGTNSHFLATDSSGHAIFVGDGTAGTPAGGVVSVQGVSGGTAIPVSFSGNTTVVGAAASGSAVSGNPVLVGGSDGTDARTMATDASGHPIIVGDGTAGTPAGGVVSIQGVSGGTVVPVSGSVTANQGTANSLANAWPTEITDGTHGPAAVKAASTAAAAADASLVVALSPNSPLPAGAAVIGAVTQSGTWTATVTQATASNLNAAVVGVGTAGTPSGGVVSIQGVASGTAIPVSGTVTATNPSVGTTGSTTPTSATLVGGTDGTNLIAVKIKDASTAAVAADPSLVVAFSPNSPLPAGSAVIGAVTQSGSWTTTVTQATASNLNAAVVGVGTAGTPSGGVVSIQGVASGTTVPISGSVTASGTVTANQGTANTLANAWSAKITDATNGPVAVKASSTAAAAADPSFVVALSPNSPIPSGANVIGAVTQSGTWTVTATSTTASNFLAEVGGLGAAGAALVGNPIQIGGSDGTDTRTLSTDTSGRQIMVGAAADGSAVVGNPVLVGGQDGTDAQALLTDTSGRPNIVGAAAQGAAVAGNPVLVAGFDGTDVQTLKVKIASTAAVAADTSLVVALSPNSPLYDNFGNPMGVKNRVAMPSTIGVLPASGLDVGLLNRTVRVGEIGTLRTTSETQLWHDAFEGSTVNTFWTQSTTTQTIAQATGVLTLNNSGITTVNTDAIITSQRQFPKYPKVGLHARYKANISANVAANHTLVEFGFGAPAGVTAVISNGCFFRVTAAGNLVGVTSYNGTENVSATLLAQGSITTTSYYRFDIFVEDQFARFIVTDANDIPVVDFQLQIPLTAPNMWAVSHLPTFARVYVDATGGGTVVKLLLSGHDVQLMDVLANKPWNVQLSSQMRNASINPTTYAQTASSMTAAPATETPSNTVGGYNTLGGDFATALTVASENPLSVFAFQIPTPYTFYLTMMQFSTPFVSTTIGVTGVPVLEWLIIANCASADINTGGGQRFPVGLNMVYTGATQAAGTFLTMGGSQVWNPDVPVTCLPGTWLHIAYKVFVTSVATTPGVTRGSVYVDGYFE